jgi:Uma2 family endonuclease
MATEKPRVFLELQYHKAAQEYLRKLPPEHFMEATSQSTQRKITLESLDLVHARRPEVQVFSELLVQYPLPRRRRPAQVVPDNMVVLYKEPIQAEGSYDVPLQPTGPLWVLEYVSKNTKRKDYEDSFRKYERELRVPYCLLFYPDNEELTLYRHDGAKYVTQPPNEHGRCALPELELEVALRDGWVRFWFRGELLPLPADLLRQLQKAQQQLEAERQARLTAEAEVARLRAELDRLRGAG